MFESQLPPVFKYEHGHLTAQKTKLADGLWLINVPAYDGDVPDLPSLQDARMASLLGVQISPVESVGGAGSMSLTPEGRSSIDEGIVSSSLDVPNNLAHVVVHVEDDNLLSRGVYALVHVSVII